MSGKKKKVSYFYDSEWCKYYYGAGHPMKPWRLRLAHELIVNYGLYKRMDVWRPRPVEVDDIEKFHDQEYLDFLQRVTPDNARELSSKASTFCVGDQTDCPIFDGLYEFQAGCAAGSVDAAVKLNHKDSDICINWAGGLHHAKKCEASGFCYLNDIVLATLELLKYHDRVLYIDIDVHHGDGVEEAFYLTDRVVCVSFHRYGDFFPGSGDLTHIGGSAGRYHTINVPLNAGLRDDDFERLFKPIIQALMERFRPGAVILQCGADSLAHDRLGCFNLTLDGHAMCVDFLKTFRVPLMLLGGGGYTIKNVARCWAYETSRALGIEISNDIPYNEFINYYGPQFNLKFGIDKSLKNLNRTRDLEDLVQRVLQNIQRIPIAPSVQIHARPADKYSGIREAQKIEKEQKEMREEPNSKPIVVRKENAITL